jgi:hypothetical protein
VIGEESDPLSLEQMQRVLQQHLDAGDYAARSGLGGGRAVREEKAKAKADGGGQVTHGETERHGTTGAEGRNRR